MFYANGLLLSKILFAMSGLLKLLWELHEKSIKTNITYATYMFYLRAGENDLDNRTIVLYEGVMEKTGDIPVANGVVPFMRVGAGDIPGYVKRIDLFGALQDQTVSCLCRIVGLQVNGEVCAGFPSPAEEELRDVISFDEYLVAHPETSFLLSVTGNSMAGAGIMEKDLVIVERGREPKNGDIILAEVDGNWTMKYFRKKGKTVILEAANPEYPPIVPQTQMRIAGVITALVRKYHK